jgi:hypothetical protein
LSRLQTFRAVRIDAHGEASPEMPVRARSYELAADRVVTLSGGAGYLDTHPLPLDIVVRNEADEARRFRCELATIEINACRICGCSEDRACNPPCSWIDDDLCSAPACLAKAGVR